MNRVFLIVFISLVLDLLAFTVILPLLPSILDYYGNNDKQGLYTYIKTSVSNFREFVGAPDTPRWNSVLFGGLIGSLFSILNFLSAPVIGAASDKYGRKPLMLICMVGVAVSYGLWALSSNFTLFVIARIVGGISKGNVSLSTAIVADVSTPEKRGKGMAWIGVAFSVGFVFGPTIGALFSVYGKSMGEVFYLLPALFALVLAISDILFVYLFLEETLPKNKRVSICNSSIKNSTDLINPVKLLKFSSVHNVSRTDLSSLQQIGSLYFIYMFLYSGLEFTLPFLMHNRFQYDSIQQGKMFFFMGVIMALVQGGYVRRVKHDRQHKVATHGMIILIPAFIIMAFASSTTLMYIGLFLFSFASGTVVPCLTTMISVHGGPEQKGIIMGTFRSLGALARAVGPILASIVYWSLGAKVCYVSGGICLILPIIQLMRVQKRINNE
ncbi:hypothetical protein LOTGIDRAFT_115354 [Lottia gigantea]|uniref:Major facilitator superfamily (MFS) profile domain-containing protein n=1 Tax=Lottia gigantea TaxID=225164 RepID=V4C5V8_LOTGI|nr:hypothetical protein LOTGIDRAFT_115354 [Lottia gigantea]ESO96999.1 hypothetical protein LOTGIDRAFT_115354 [Lottia gigantea]